MAKSSKGKSKSGGKIGSTIIAWPLGKGSK
jgi:hypothetical protein